MYTALNRRLYGWVYKFRLPAAQPGSQEMAPLPTAWPLPFVTQPVAGLSSGPQGLGPSAAWALWPWCCPLPVCTHPLTPGSQLAGLPGGGGGHGACQLTSALHLSLGQSPTADLGIDKLRGDGRTGWQNLVYESICFTGSV